MKNKYFKLVYIIICFILLQMKKIFKLYLLSCIFNGLLGAEIRPFSSSLDTPSPSCLSANVNGEVYVGIDKNGSLGRGPGKGLIMKLTDTDMDGVADKKSIFSQVDHPRGLISIGNKVYVLHSIYDAEGIISSIQLSMLEDNDRDGVADSAPIPLVKHLSTIENNQRRGVNHSTHGISMGIDGWIYVAIGDYGFVNAEDASGKKLSLLGGGVVRVRPDGTNLQIYTTGLRNIYDIAIDGEMNIYTRDNTNDGEGWNVRFSHNIQNADFGYPSKFINYTHEILPAIADLSGGSGTGALFLDDPQWPEELNQLPLMADWGRKGVFSHKLKKDGASFTQQETLFLELPQPIDLDIDGSGRLYIANWDGAGYKGSEEKGHTIQVTPKNWQYKATPDFKELSLNKLIECLVDLSAKIRLEAQQEILSRSKEINSDHLNSITSKINDSKLSLYPRLAALYTYAQLGLTNEKLSKIVSEHLISLINQPELKPSILRVLSEHSLLAQHAPLAIYLNATKSTDDRVKIAAYNAFPLINNNNTTEIAKSILDSQPVEIPIKPMVVLEKETIELKANQLQKISYELPLVQNITLNFTSENPENTVLVSNFKFILNTQETRQLVMQNRFISKGVNLDFPENRKIRDTHSGITKFSINGNGEFKFPIKDFMETLNFEIISDFDAVLEIKPAKGFQATGDHATPNSKIIAPHIAVKNLIKLNAWQSCLDAINSPSQDVALQALTSMYAKESIQPLINKFNTAKDEALKDKLLYTLGRLYQKEVISDGSWWWDTRPNTFGPFFQGEQWSESKKIADFYSEIHSGKDPYWAKRVGLYNYAFKMNLPDIPLYVDEVEEKYEGLNFAAVMSKQGEIANMSLEEIVASLDTVKGDIALGEKMFNQQGCIVCHNNGTSTTPKGPNMAQIGSILDRAELVESIINPSASISQGFPTTIVTTQQGETYSGFIIKKTPDQLQLMNIAGNRTIIAQKDIVSQKQDSTVSQMPPGLANALDLDEFISLVDYLKSLK